MACVLRDLLQGGVWRGIRLELYEARWSLEYRRRVSVLVNVWEGLLHVWLFVFLPPAADRKKNTHTAYVPLPPSACVFHIQSQAQLRVRKHTRCYSGSE